MKPASWLLSLLALVLLVQPAHALVEAVQDTGSYRISRNGRTLGTERFSFAQQGDSLVVASYVHELVPGKQGLDTLQKTMAMVVKAEDYDLRSYESHQYFMGQKIHRGLVMEDTVMSSYIQVDEHGVGDRLVRPPGRMFVIDPQVFALYDVICRNLHDRTFDRRDVLFFVLGSPDTSYSATATDMGHETIRWGSAPVQARKIRIDGGEAEFYLWISPRGYMLRLAQPAYGIGVERIHRPIKKSATRPRSGG